MNRRGTQKRRLTLALWWIALVSAICASAAVAQPFALKDGDTVVFYGDSITAQRAYTRYVEEFILTRYPSQHFRFVNAGVPGDTASGGYTGTMAERVARDVAPYKPGVITVMLGMNDGGWGYGTPQQIEADFQARYNTLLGALHKAAPGANFTLISSTPYDEITHGTEFPGYSRMVDRLADDVSQIAAQKNASEPPVFFADFHLVMNHALERAKASNPQLAPLLIPDRIHPAKTSHWIMAAALMSAWHVNPVVSAVTLSAAGNVVTRERTQVSNLVKSSAGLQWTQLDEALPLPLDFNDAMTPLLLQISNIADLDRQTLRVESLAPGQYRLSIDGKPIATFSRDELQSGVNLALQKTPMLEQARAVDSTEEQRAELDHARFVLSADVKPIPTTNIAEATIRAAQAELDRKVRDNTSPQPHRFELRLEQ
jgi:lysophospholipase L1-like esterase